MRKNKWIIIVVLLFGLPVLAQDSVYTFEAFFQRVKDHHPATYRAELVAESGEAQVLSARGGFDPELGGAIKQKYYAEKQYYSYVNGYLKVPTWFGVSLETGYDQTGGVYLNPESRLPQSGLLYAGVSIELGNGLIIDQRRAALQQAQFYQQASVLEQRILLNQLLNDASNAYWKWMLSYRKRALYLDAVAAAEARRNAVAEYVQFGDRPAIDETEATLQYQSRLMQLEQADAEWKNASAALEVFLWDLGRIPLELDGAIPEIPEAGAFRETTLLQPEDSTFAQHPIVVLNDLEFQRLNVDLKLKKEYLKPKVTLNYRALNEPVAEGFFDEYSVANYTWGAKVSYPILTRRERADVQLAALKVEGQTFKSGEVQAKLRYQVIKGKNTIEMNRRQLEIVSVSVEGSRALLEAENDLFENGESSLFMVNSRELKLLDNQVKMAEIQAKLAIAFYDLRYGVWLDAQP